jgi:hypothetical protein
MRLSGTITAGEVINASGSKKDPDGSSTQTTTTLNWKEKVTVGGFVGLASQQVYTGFPAHMAEDYAGKTVTKSKYKGWDECNDSKGYHHSYSFWVTRVHTSTMTGRDGGSVSVVLGDPGGNGFVQFAGTATHGGYTFSVNDSSLTLSLETNGTHVVNLSNDPCKGKTVRETDEPDTGTDDHVSGYVDSVGQNAGQCPTYSWGPCKWACVLTGGWTVRMPDRI